MNDKKKILMIVPMLANGGAERVVSNLSIELHEEYDIDIFIDYNNIGYDYKGEIFACLPKLKTKPNRIQSIFLYIKKYLMLRRMKRKNQYDTYISHSRMSNFLNVLSGSKKCDTICTIHYSIERRYKRSKGIKLWFLVEKFSYHNAKKVVAVSKGISDEVEKIYGVSRSKIHVVWNGADREKLQTLSKQAITKEQATWFNDNKHNIATVGRYTEPKAHWHLIRAFSKVLQDYPDAKLIILGEGNERKYYEELISSLGINSNVILGGFLDNPFSIVNKSDIFVLSSLREGMPYTLVEALMCEKPCIVTDFKCGSREVLNIDEEVKIPKNQFMVGEYGILTPICSGNRYSGSDILEKSEELLADSIIYLLNNPKIGEKLVENNSHRLQMFSISEMKRKWINVIEN